MNNKKGEVTLGFIILALVTVVFGVAILNASADQVGQSTNLQTAVNVSYTLPAAATALTLVGRDNTTALIVVNSTNTTQVLVNYTTTSGFENGITITPGANLASQDVNISYTFKPDGYMNNSSDRTVFALVVLFFTLAIAVSVLPKIEELLNL